MLIPKSRSVPRRAFPPLEPFISEASRGGPIARDEAGPSEVERKKEKERYREIPHTESRVQQDLGAGCGLSGHSFSRSGKRLSG